VVGLNRRINHNPTNLGHSGHQRPLRMPATILHISDLHRDSGSAITSITLLESLRLDRERYMSGDQMPAPDIAVVSGDMVLGVAADGPDADARLLQQYEEASEFLTSLTDLFFGGNRERVVLIPGNHDISHPHVLRATELTALPAESEQRAMVARQLREEDSVWRWVGPEFSLRRIHDPRTYHRRLEPYANFYSAFYQGKRSFPIEPSKQFVVHDFPELGLVVAALSSCCNNDLFNRVGRIHPECVAGATRAVDKQVKRGQVALATWHHNLAGGPNDSDYVDADVLQSLIDGGFVIGLHGHQHRPQFLEHRFTADGKRGIAVISAGTLCGGPYTLPSGRMRAYNVVVVDTENQAGVLHVRDMKNSSFGSPVWGPAHVTEFSGSSLAFPLKMPPRSTSAMDAASEAASLLRKGDPAGAAALVRPHGADALARRVAVEALEQLKDWTEIQRMCNPPSSPAEFIVLAEALYELGQKSKLAALIASDFARHSNDVGVRQSIDLARSRLGGL
jgi:predicted MPP superfamily phosphohydrolase